MEASFKSKSYSDYEINPLGIRSFLDRMKSKGIINQDGLNSIKGAIKYSVQKSDINLFKRYLNDNFSFLSNYPKTSAKLEKKVLGYIKLRNFLPKPSGPVTNPVGGGTTSFGILPSSPIVPPMPYTSVTSMPTFIPTVTPISTTFPFASMPFSASSSFISPTPMPSIPFTPATMTPYIPPLASIPFSPMPSYIPPMPSIPLTSTMMGPYPTRGSIPTMPSTSFGVPMTTPPSDIRKRAHNEAFPKVETTNTEVEKRQKYKVSVEERNETVKKIKTLRSQYIKDDIDAEHVRLCSSSEDLGKKISSELLKNMQHAFNRDQIRLQSRASTDTRLNWSLSRQQVKNIQIMVGRTLELQKALPDHYVFLHAQSSAWLCVGMLMKEILKIKIPEVNRTCFKVLRWPGLNLPHEVTPSDLVDDHNEDIRERLISADGFLLNHSTFESYLDLLVKNISISGGYEKVAQILMKLLIEKCKLDPSIDPKPYINKIMNVVQSAPNSGNLFAYVIPKKTCEVFQKAIVYASHPYGRPCNCCSDEFQWERLKQLQQGKLDGLGCNTQIVDKMGRQIPMVPQYRIQALVATPRRGCCVVRLTPFDLQDYKNQLRECVKSVAKELAPYMRIP